MDAGSLLPRTAPRLGLVLLATSDDEARFGRIRQIVANDEGLIFVADQLTQEIVVLDSLGRHLRTIGGRGEGPGEFADLTSLAWQGDTLLALDFKARRITRFRGDGSLISSWPWPADAGRPARLYEAGADAFVSGTIAGPTVLFRSAAEAAAMHREPEIRYSALASDGSARFFVAFHDTASELRGFECDGPGVIEGFTEPLFGYSGPLRAFTAGGELAMSSPDAFRIDIVDLPSGDTVRTIQRDYPAQPVTDADWADATRYYRERDRIVGPLECDIESMRPDSLPVLRSITADAAGRLWVEARSGDGYAISVIDREGRLIGEAPLPPRDERVPLYVRNGRLYLVAIDEYDVQSIEVYKGIANATLEGGFQQN